MFLTIGLIVALIVVMCVIVGVGYFKAPTDKAYIVSGLTKEPRIVIGKASFRVPFFERVDVLDLGLISLDVKTVDRVPTKECINISVDSFATVRVKNDPASLPNAYTHFLNMDKAQMGTIIRQVLEGSLRDIVGAMNLQDMMSNRQAFADKVQESAVKDLQNMGIEIVSFNVQNFEDENDVITDMGIDRVVAIQKSAKIAKANAERDILVAEASATKQANDAKAEAQKAIAEKNTEVEIRKAELKQKFDIKQAEANSAYDIQEQVQKKEQNIREVEASIAKTEKQVALQAKEAEVREKELDAKIRRQAEADKYKKQLEAEAERYAKEQQAQADLVTEQKKAEAIQYSALKEAEAIKAKGEAEATAIRAKGLAEAETLEKKAEAMKKYGDAAKMEMIVKALPEVANAVATPLANCQNMSVYSTNGNGLEMLGNNVPIVMKQTFDTIKNATGFDMTKVMEAGTIDAKVNRNYSIEGGVPVNVANPKCSETTQPTTVVD